MEWIWDAANSIGVVALAVWAWSGFRYLGKENDLRKADNRRALSRVSEAAATALEARRDATYARKAVKLLNDDQVVVGRKLPKTPANESLVERLREAAARAKSKAEHPAGTYRVPGVRRSAVTGRYVTPSSSSSDNGMLGVAAVIAATSVDTSSSSSYSDSSSSSSSSSYDSGSSSSSDSGSFGGGDSGSF